MRQSHTQFVKETSQIFFLRFDTRAYYQEVFVWYSLTENLYVHFIMLCSLCTLDVTCTILKRAIIFVLPDGVCRSKESELNQAISAGKRRLGNLEGSRKNRLKLYADYMPSLLEEIERCDAKRQFHQKPLGPIGKYMLQVWAFGKKLASFHKAFYLHFFSPPMF